MNVREVIKLVTGRKKIEAVRINTYDESEKYYVGEEINYIYDEILNLLVDDYDVCLLPVPYRVGIFRVLDIDCVI